MPYIPKYIATAVKNYDPRLRLRWSKERKRFVLEIKATRAKPPNPVFYRPDGNKRLIPMRVPVLSDRYIQHRDGYLPILEATKIDLRLLRVLRETDMHRRGAAAVRDMEEKQLREEAAERAKEDAFVNDMSKDAFDTLQCLQGEKVYLGA